jgi:MHS family citrate/tricarballylate:H+ symporter-like MFS transporter
MQAEDTLAGEQIATVKRDSKLVTVLRITCGNFLEMFDFFLFGLYARNIAAAFFPAKSEIASLILTFATFGAGFLMRPLGAIVLGAYVDSVGRRKGLVVTLCIMAIGTLMIAFVPSFATIGLAAPLLVLVGRLLQGFSAGVEVGGVSVYLSEMASPGNKGFMVSWQSASQQLAVIAGAAIGFGLSQTMSQSEIADWGWRIPFAFGSLLVPFLFYIRRSLQETPDFLARAEHPSLRAVFISMAANWRLVTAGTLLVTMTTVSFYLITVYTPTFGQTVMKLSQADSLAVTCAVGLSNFIWLPLSGAVSDRIGRLKVLLFFTITAILTVYPTLSWLAVAPGFNRMLMVELWLSFLYAGYNGAMVVALTEVMPKEVRTAGFSLAYSLATAIFGGFTPAVSTWLIATTDDKASPGLWMSAAAVCGLAATLMLRRRFTPVIPAAA